MSKSLALHTPSGSIREFTQDQVSLIKATVAKGASDSELKLFLYRCQNMGLDPLKPGQVHFIKYGSNPGSIVVGIEGFRSLAARTGKLVGVKRGVLRDAEGKCIGAWCEIYRSDWQYPAREEVSLAEYTTGKNMWAKMPETMVKKVAECAALRMAFPDDLGGVYGEEEMHQASRDASPTKAAQVNNLLSSATDAEVEIEPEEPDFVTEAAAGEPTSPGDFIIPIGKQYRGKRLSEVALPTLKSFAQWVVDKVENKNEDVKMFLMMVDLYVKEQESV